MMSFLVETSCISLRTDCSFKTFLLFVFYFFTEIYFCTFCTYASLFFVFELALPFDKCFSRFWPMVESQFAKGDLLSICYLKRSFAHFSLCWNVFLGLALPFANEVSKILASVESTFVLWIPFSLLSFFGHLKLWCWILCLFFLSLLSLRLFGFHRDISSSVRPIDLLCSKICFILMIFFSLGFGRCVIF